jgi:hypothetical protein
MRFLRGNRWRKLREEEEGSEKIETFEHGESENWTEEHSPLPPI